MLCNVDPDNPANAPGAEELLRYGFRGVRLVSRHGVENYTDAMWSAGLMVLGVVTEQSGGYLCPADVYQIGNEPDVAGTADYRPAPEYVSYWNLYRDTYSDLMMIGAGLGSGQTSYWQAVKNAGGLHGAAGFAVHPYGKSATAAMSLLLNYRAITPSLGLWVTEWNRPTAETPEFAAMLDRLSGVVCHARFAWGGQSDNQFNATPTQLRLLGCN